MPTSPLDYGSGGQEFEFLHPGTMPVQRPSRRRWEALRHFPTRGAACATGLTPQREWASARSSIGGITELAYSYDVGDDWRRKITIEATAAVPPLTIATSTTHARSLPKMSRPPRLRAVPRRHDRSAAQVAQRPHALACYGNAATDRPALNDAGPWPGLRVR